ncbi:hypothetical protein DB30_02694 [Enhygromyxa salina]|uniref:Uncharacterized protein n=1 Tax=Enhygromyxa salina TaxID=215803 RepID=A0A0C2A7D6_9BACT|nr:PAAR-like domain-containing protein [Enhygromyxa salina]KIG19413.1 hypothetical protein DB30_02694 [Enhygromyxa salina]
MSSVSVNSPKTPVTAGSNGIAAATLPNVCKMPGPPAPFVPTPLPNIAKSGTKPKGFTKDVKIEGKTIAVKGASFGSQGDAASKGTGGGVVSANTDGPAKFVGPGSLDVKAEGKSIQLLSDPMVNNCGPSGSPPNAATVAGIMQLAQAMMYPEQAGNTTTECTSSFNHTWVHREACGKKRMSQKIDEAASHPLEGIRFEAAAAAHNKATGDLTRSGQLSQEPHEEKVFWVCSECGIEREGDQLHDDPNGGPPHMVEVKFKSELSTRDAKQLGRNIQAVKQGNASGLVYKVPASGGGDFLCNQIKRLGEVAGQAIRVVRI